MNEQNEEKLDFHWFWLTPNKKNPNQILWSEFMDMIYEEGFRENKIEKILFAIYYTVRTLCLIIASNFFNYVLSFIALRLCFTILNWLIVFRFTREKIKKNLTLARKLYFIFSLMNSFYYLIRYFLAEFLGVEDLVEILLFFIVYMHPNNLNFFYGTILYLVTSMYLYLFLIKDSSLGMFVNVVLLHFCLTLILYSFRERFKNLLLNFNTVRIHTIKKNQQNDLIINLLPSHILEKFLRNPNEKLNLTNEFENVTILFADIVGFTKFSSSVPATEVVHMLQELFTEFDKLCIENYVYKLYTIGDCYVVLGMIDADERNIEQEALNVVKMGFGMLEKINEVKKKISFNALNMRIGIHTVYLFIYLFEHFFFYFD